jgi:hypothetical protein
MYRFMENTHTKFSWFTKWNFVKIEDVILTVSSNPVRDRVHIEFFDGENSYTAIFKPSKVVTEVEADTLISATLYHFNQLNGAKR